MSKIGTRSVHVGSLRKISEISCKAMAHLIFNARLQFYLKIQKLRCYKTRQEKYTALRVVHVQ